MHVGMACHLNMWLARNKSQVQEIERGNCSLWSSLQLADHFLRDSRELLLIAQVVVMDWEQRQKTAE